MARADVDAAAATADVYEGEPTATADFQLFSTVSRLGKSVKMQFETLMNVFRSATGTSAGRGRVNCGGWENSEGGCAKKVILDLCASERESDVNDGRLSAIVSIFCFFFY